MMKRRAMQMLGYVLAGLCWPAVVWGQSVQGALVAIRLDAQPPMVHVSTDNGQIQRLPLDPEETRITQQGEALEAQALRVGQVVKVTLGEEGQPAKAIEVLPPESPEAQASTYRAGDKLVRGLGNVFTGFLEIPRNIHLTTLEDNLLMGWTVGLGKGLGFTLLRMGTGVYETVTFPFPLPPGYVPIVSPAFVWQAAGPDYI